MSSITQQPFDRSGDASPTSFLIIMPNPSTYASSKTLDTCQTIAMNRTDNGFGENKITPDDPLSKASSMSTIDGGKVRPVRSQRRRSRKDVLKDADGNFPLPRTKNLASFVEDVSPPATPQRISSQRKSKTPGSHRSSRSSSRRSSFINQPTTINHRRPAMPRSMSTTYARPVEDPIALYHRSRSLFEAPRTDPSATLSPSLSPLPRPSMAPADDLSQGLLVDEEENSPIAHQYSNHVPATVIDWTLPSTRRREYRQIEGSYRGIPGLWRRFGPRLFQRNRRLTFYDDEKGDDAGSVRRYRMDLPEEEEKSNSVVRVCRTASSLEKVKRKWSCIGSFTRDS